MRILAGILAFVLTYLALGFITDWSYALGFVVLLFVGMVIVGLVMYVTGQFD